MTALPARTQSLSLREARPEDAPLVLSFLIRLMTYQKLAQEVTVSEERVAELIRKGSLEAVLAIAAEEPVGCIVFNTTASVYTGREGLFIDGFFVDDRLRGQGIGRAMMAHLAKLSRERGGAMLEWGCLDWNTPTINFYRGLGAYVLDEMRVYRLAAERLEELAAEA